MADRFYARFNLSREDFLAYKEEFDELQKAREEALKKELPYETATLNSKKVLFIGDSITSDNLGYRISVSRAAELSAINGSLSSSNSSALLEQSLRLIESEKPEIVSIMLGTNDSISIGALGNNQVPLEEYTENMKKIVRKAKDAGAIVLLFEIPIVHEELFSEYFNPRGKFQTNETVKLYNEKLAEIAVKASIPLIEHSWLTGVDFTPFFEPDGVHLSEKAQAHFSRNWLINASNLIKNKGEEK